MLNISKRNQFEAGIEKNGVSVVVPVFNSSKTLTELTSRIIDNLPHGEENFEIIYVDDGSQDNSWDLIEKLANEHNQITGIKLTRNFGQHYAIAAGLECVKYSKTVVMDADLQDLPEEIPKLLNAMSPGVEIVLARRTQRQDSTFRKIASIIFYKTLSRLAGFDQDPAVSNFGVYSKSAVQKINQMPEKFRYLPAMISWIGYPRKLVDVKHGARESGKSNYNFSKLASLARDIVISYSDRPLQALVQIGLAVASLGFVFAIYTLFRAVAGDYEVIGYSSIIISIWTLSGILIVTISVVGMYVGKSFEATKNRPLYVVQKKTK